MRAWRSESGNPKCHAVSADQSVLLTRPLLTRWARSNFYARRASGLGFEIEGAAYAKFAIIADASALNGLLSLRRERNELFARMFLNHATIVRSSYCL
jgi:hypothetical protein